ncbi:hypothetical protein P8452_13074 [Trifolium repens]|nr:hypothetical protein P8452_13074 [Trifolium repens]
MNLNSDPFVNKTKFLLMELTAFTHCAATTSAKTSLPPERLQLFCCILHSSTSITPQSDPTITRKKIGGQIVSKDSAQLKEGQVDTWLKCSGIIWIYLEETKEYKKNEGHETMERIGFYSHDIVIYMNNTYNVNGHFMTSIKIGSKSCHIIHEIEITS